MSGQWDQRKNLLKIGQRIYNITKNAIQIEVAAWFE